MTTDEPTPPESGKKPLVIGRITIAAENVAEWEALNERTHEFIVARKKIPKEIRVRMFILEGLSPGDAEIMVRCEGGELRDCHAISEKEEQRRDAAQRLREEKARQKAEKRKPHPLPQPRADRPPAAKG